jgi:short-subunit dehydrogenase
METKQTTVVITGASSGFGERAAALFASVGHRVWGTMRDTQGRNAAKKTSLEAQSSNITILDMDVTDDVSVTSAFEKILSHGSIDILINNAGVMYVGLTEAFSVSQAHEQMNTNYYGVIRTTQAVLPAMRKAGRGLIINTSSIVGRLSPPFFGTYTATKHALEGYSQALRYEVATSGVDIALVEPGPFATELLNRSHPPALEAVVASYGDLSQVPVAMGRNFEQMLAGEDPLTDPQLVAQAYLNLAAMPAGTRPMRTVVGLSWGVDDINRLTQPIQDRILSDFQLDGVLGGASA